MSNNNNDNQNQNPNPNPNRNPNRNRNRNDETLEERLGVEATDDVKLPNNYFFEDDDSEDSDDNYVDDDTNLIPMKAHNVFKKLAFERAILDYKLERVIVGGVGENSYGTILKVKLKPRETMAIIERPSSVRKILKISPKNESRRLQMRVVDYYKREVFMYEKVFREYRQLIPKDSTKSLDDILPQIMPKYYYSSLEAKNEFLIFENLFHSGYIQNARNRMPTKELVIITFKALAQLHGMSFVLQTLKPDVFETLIAKMSDNFFCEEMSSLAVDSGKKYVRRVQELIEKDYKSKGLSLDDPKIRKMFKFIDWIEENYKEYGLHCVNGRNCAPYAVICHGDFWNNNVLYKYNSNNVPIAAKLIDFQISRYASPILDLVYYTCTCTDKNLRENNFLEYLEVYYTHLTKVVAIFNLRIENIYPKKVFCEQFREYGAYGFCMGALSLPFFLSDSTESPDLDQLTEDIEKLKKSEENERRAQATKTHKTAGSSNRIPTAHSQLLDKHDLLNERTSPIFKERMFDIVADALKYKMDEEVFKINLPNQL